MKNKKQKQRPQHQGEENMIKRRKRYRGLEKS